MKFPLVISPAAGILAIDDWYTPHYRLIIGDGLHFTIWVRYAIAALSIRFGYRFYSFMMSPPPIFVANIITLSLGNAILISRYLDIAPVIWFRDGFSERLAIISPLGRFRRRLSLYHRAKFLLRLRHATSASFLPARQASISEFSPLTFDFQSWFQSALWRAADDASCRVDTRYGRYYRRWAPTRVAVPLFSTGTLVWDGLASRMRASAVSKISYFSDAK